MSPSLKEEVKAASTKAIIEDPGKDKTTKEEKTAARLIEWKRPASGDIDKADVSGKKKLTEKEATDKRKAMRDDRVKAMRGG
jgi:hypothetical protein